MGSQNVVGNCTGTGENDWCFSPSSKNDCNACNDKGDQDGDQNGWTDAIADQCDANCVFDFEVHVNGTTIGPNKYESVEKSCSDGLDNDCDGKTDKADIDCLECKSGDTRACGNGKGECKQGTQTCTANNTWGACTGGVGPKNETCNRKDDNCNGKIDETWDDDSDGFVVNATACKGNYTQFDCDDTNPAIRPGAIEICIDKIDNNCNGLIDSAAEGCNATNLTQSLVPKFAIGNGKCEPPGETQQNAPIDCGCPEGFDLVGNKCEEDKPQQVCGNSIQEAPEQCDGTDSSLCPGLCSVDCSCPFIVGDGICSKDAGETRANSPDDCKISPVLIIGIILLIVILSAVGAGYYLTHKKKQLADLTEAHQVEMPSTETEGNIDAYINNTLSLGFKPDDIRDSLIKAGWDTDTIDSALEDAHTDLQKLGGSAEKYGVDIAREDVEKVDSYIKDMRAQNYSPTQIKTTLESAGWPASTVETEIGKLTQPELQKSAEKAGVDKPSKDSKGAEEWASDALNKGHTAEQVRGTLETAGWPPSDVKAAVKV
jgi:SOS response regulatory protein OraA/RecX